MKNILNNISREIHLPVWLITLLVIVFLLRIPSFFEPYWYGDEQIYLTLGQGIGKELLLYRDIYDNKPPLLYLVAAIAGNLFWFKVILGFWSITTIVLFYKLAQLLWAGNERVVRYSTITLTLLTTIPLLEGNIANAELFMILPTIASFLILLSGRINPRRVFIAGMVAGIGVLFKVPSLIDIGVPVVLWYAIWTLRRMKFSQWVAQSGLFVAGAISPILLSVIFFAIAGAAREYISAAFLQTVGYLSSWRVAEGGFFTRNQPLIMRLVISAVVVAMLLRLYQRRRVSRSFLFASTWFVLSLFAALLSERPYPHYLIQIVPSFSLLVGVTLAANAREQFYPYPLFALLGAALVFYKFTYYAVFPYYENFLGWVMKQQTDTQFFSRFDQRTPRNYEIAQFLTQSAQDDDRLFVWGDEPELYTLSHLTPATRYVASYHVKDLRVFDEVAESLQSNPPRFIVTTSSELEFPQLATLLNLQYVLVNYVQNARIWLHVTINKE